MVLCASDGTTDQVVAAYRVRWHYWGNGCGLHFLPQYEESGLCPEWIAITPSPKFNSGN